MMNVLARIRLGLSALLAPDMMTRATVRVTALDRIVARTDSETFLLNQEMQQTISDFENRKRALREAAAVEVENVARALARNLRDA